MSNLVHTFIDACWSHQGDSLNVTHQRFRVITSGISHKWTSEFDYICRVSFIHCCLRLLVNTAAFYPQPPLLEDSKFFETLFDGEMANQAREEWEKAMSELAQEEPELLQHFQKLSEAAGKVGKQSLNRCLCKCWTNKFSKFSTFDYPISTGSLILTFWFRLRCSFTARIHLLSERHP